MVQYLYAKNTIDELVDISDITPENRTKFFCPSCGNEMSAVLGNYKEHHFRHKGDSCSYESYLHRISKLLLKWKFDHNPSFDISYWVTQGCDREPCPLRDSKCDSQSVLHKINLKEHYDLCEIEGSYNGFRADLKFSSSKNPEAKPLFIEIAVSHACTPKKISSGINIIEISVTNERDALLPIVEDRAQEEGMQKTDIILSQQTKGKFRFYNFERRIFPQRQLSRFLVVNNEGYPRGS